MCVFLTIATCLWPAGVPVPFSCPFLLWCSFPFLSFSFLFFYVFAHWSISAVVSTGILCVCFPHESNVFVPCRAGLFPFLVSSSLFFHCFCLWLTTFFSLPYLLCFFVHSSSFIYICCSFHGHSMCVFLMACRGIWSSLFSYPLVFSCPVLLWCSFSFLFFYVFFAQWSTYICCSFHGHSMFFLHHSHVFVPYGGTCSFFSYPLPFSCPFILWCSFPFLSSMSFLPIDLYLL